jgi:hypothetical protein
LQEEAKFIRGIEREVPGVTVDPDDPSFAVHLGIGGDRGSLQLSMIEKFHGSPER